MEHMNKDFEMILLCAGQEERIYSIVLKGKLFCLLPEGAPKEWRSAGWLSMTLRKACMEHLQEQRFSGSRQLMELLGVMFRKLADSVGLPLTVEWSQEVVVDGKTMAAGELPAACWTVQAAMVHMAPDMAVHSEQQHIPRPLEKEPASCGPQSSKKGGGLRALLFGLGKKKKDE